jgi:hypothetical protein
MKTLGMIMKVFTFGVKYMAVIVLIADCASVLAEAGQKCADKVDEYRKSKQAKPDIK